MHPSVYAKSTPEKPAYIMADSGHVTTYAQLEEASNRGAQLFRALGLVAGDHIAILMENNHQLLKIFWAAQRSGLVFTFISTHLQHDEICYIAGDCEAKVFISSVKLSETLGSLVDTLETVDHFFLVDGELEGFESWEQSLAGQPVTPIDDEELGVQMLYSSGTTGLPKGIMPERTPGDPIDRQHPTLVALQGIFGMDESTVYLSPAPLYHAAPLTYNYMVLSTGGTSIIMEKFDAQQSLALIEKYRVSHSQWVPIMFIRMLKLPESSREQYDLSSMRVAIHAAAPCPVEVKEKMIDWWGPIIFEYYSSTEGNGATAIDSAGWLSHKGSVGLPLGCEIHILDEEGKELPAGQTGQVYFSGTPYEFKYHNSPEKTASAYTADGFSTVGDMGHVDEEGFLYLADRADFMINSGGVNIYPQEVENLLINHDLVADAAVFGIPNEEFGEEVKAVVELQNLAPDDTSDIEAELMAYCKQHLAHYKCPRSVDFIEQMPRLDNGKLYKRHLRGAYH